MTEEEYGKRLRVGARCVSLAEYDITLAVEGHGSGRPWLDPVWRYFWLSEHPRVRNMAEWIRVNCPLLGAILSMAGFGSLTAFEGIFWPVVIFSAAAVSGAAFLPCQWLVGGFERESERINLLRNPGSDTSFLGGVLSSILLTGSTLRPGMFTRRNI